MFILAFLGGIVSLQLFQSLPDIWLIFTLLLAVLGCYALFKRRIFAIILIFILGFLWMVINVHYVMHRSLPARLIQKKITIAGYVVSIPKTEGDSTKFIFSWNKMKISLSWYGKYPDLKVGDKWQLQVKLKPPHGSMNPGGFDYEKYLFQNRIRATGYVNSGKLITSYWYNYPISRWRQRLANKIVHALPNNQFAGLLVALTVGSRNYISQTQWQVFRNTGTSHLVAISGLHIGLVSGFMFLILLFVWRRFAWLTLRMPAMQAAAVGALIAAVIYSIMAGLSLPTERALIMITVFMLALLWRRNIRPWQAFLLALLLVLIINPLATLNAGFWLSFAAVGILIYSFSGRIGAQGWWWQWIRPQLVIAIGLIPVLLLLFQQFSAASLLANIIAIPWVGFVVVPLALLGSLMPHGSWLLWLAAKAMALIWLYLQWLSMQHGVIWQHAIVNNWVLVTAMIGILLLLAPKGFPARWLGIIWLLPLLLFKPAGPKFGEVWFTLLDVGQGLASVVRTQHHVLIYDTGPKFNDNFDAGKAIVVPFLHMANIKQVDMLVISHGDNDHIGGAQSVLNMLRVKQIMTSVPQRFSQRPARYCQAGQIWDWDGVSFRFLSPLPNEDLQGNAASCVLQIQDGNTRLLLTGDIEAETEHLLVQRYGSKLHATVLVAPHHGSNSSSTIAFVNAVQPKYVLFPVGFLNRFHFPSAKVLARYKSIKALLLNTVNAGAITFKFNANKVSSVIETREKLSHYWNNK